MARLFDPPAQLRPWQGALTMSRGWASVQSTTVEAAHSPVHGHRARATAHCNDVREALSQPAAPGAGGLPGRLADVEVRGKPRAATRRAIPG